MAFINEFFSDFLRIGDIASPTTDFSKKYSFQETTSTQSTFAPVYSPVITRNVDVQYNLASGGSTVSTKKDQAIEQAPFISPNVSPSLTVVPSITQTGSGKQIEPSDSGAVEESFVGDLIGNATGIVVVGLIVGAVYLWASGGKE